MPFRYQRRAVLKGLAALAASGWIPPGAAQNALAPLDAVRFRALTSTVTGFAFGDPATAGAMLRALNAAVGASALSRIANLAAIIPPAQLGDELRIAGLERQAATVIAALFSGVVDTPKGPVVVSYGQALAWQALRWTKPNAECGGETNYWANAPAGTRP